MQNQNTVNRLFPHSNKQWHRHKIKVEKIQEKCEKVHPNLVLVLNHWYALKWKLRRKGLLKITLSKTKRSFKIIKVYKRKNDNWIFNSHVIDHQRLRCKTTGKFGSRDEI